MEFLSIIEEFVLNIGGKDAVKLLSILKDNENVSEFDLAEELKLNINQVRNILYKLNSYNLVYSNRKKDREKGWYIYYWTFNFKHARDILKTNKEKKIQELDIELEKGKQHRFFVCPNGDMRMELEEALENDYKCTECGSILKQEDSTKKIGEISHKITTLQQELEELKKPVKISPIAKEEVKVKRKSRKSKKKTKKKSKAKKKSRKTKKVKPKKKGKKKSKPKKVRKFKKLKSKKKTKKSSKILKKLKKFKF